MLLILKKERKKKKKTKNCTKIKIKNTFYVLFIHFIIYYLKLLKLCSIHICFHCTEKKILIFLCFTEEACHRRSKWHEGEKIIFIFGWTFVLKDSCADGKHTQKYTHIIHKNTQNDKSSQSLYNLSRWPFFSPVSRHVMLHDSHTTYPKQKRSSAQHYWAKCFSTGYLFSGIA